MPGWFDSATLSAGASHVLPVLLDAAVKSLIVLVPAIVATAVMRRSSAAARHFVWFLAVAGLVILPIVSATLPGWQILPRWIDLSADAAPDVAAFQPLESESAAPVALEWSNEPAGPRDSFKPTTAPPAAIGEVEATPDELTTDRQEAAAIAPEPEEPRPSDGPQRSRARVLLACVPLVWAAGALLVLGWLSLGAAIMRRLGRRCEPIVDGSWTALLGRLSAELKLDRSVRLLRSDRRSMPMAWGLFRPKLLLPAEAADWPADRCRVVLLHELAHIKRRDPLTQFITQIACALYWFNPLVWVASRRMVTERERACDDLVLAAGSPACDYADHVLQIASSLRTGRLVGAAAIAMARPSSLEGRLLAILDNQRSRRALTRTAVVLLVVAFAAIILPIGMMRAMGGPERKDDASSVADSRVDAEKDPTTRPAAATAPAVPAGRAGLRIRYAIPGDEEEAEFGVDNGLRVSWASYPPSVRVRNGGETVVDHLSPGRCEVFRIRRLRVAGRSAGYARCDERVVELEEGTITPVEFAWSGWPIEGELVGATQEEMGSAKMYVQSLDPKWPRLLDAFECPPDGKWKTAPVPPGQYRVFVHVTRGLKFRIHYRAPDLGEFIGDAKITVTKEARPGPVRIVRLVKPKPNVPRTTSPGLSTLKISFEIPGAGETNEFVVEPFDIAGICKPGMLSTSPPPPGIELERTVTIRNGGKAALHNLLPGRWRIMRWKEVPGLPMGSVGCEDSVVEVEADKTTTADFVRRECWPLEGELADATPDEIAHAFVTVQSALPGGSGSTVVYDAVKCAPDGTWKTLPIPPGEYWVVAQLIPSPVGAKAPGQAKITVSQGVRPPRVRLSKDSVRRPSASTRPEGASQSSTTAMRTAAGADEAAFGSQVTGVVVDEVGKPVGGAVVGFMRGWAADKTVTTGEEGAFVLACGRTSLRYEDVLAVTDGGERQGVHEFGPEVPDAATRTPVKIVLKTSRRVSVRVVDGSGKPVSGATVGATGYFVETPIQAGKTGEDGTFLLRVPVDLDVKWVVGFKAGVGFDYFENYPFWPPRGSERQLLPEQIKLVLDGARQVRIRAVDSDGRPLPEVGFVPWTIRKPGKMADVNLSGSRLAAQSTDAQGIASFDWLPVNVTQDVAFLCHDREDLHMPEYPRLRPGSSETELTARLLRHAQIAGKVLLPDGTPARDVLIQAEGRGATNHPCGKSVRTAADGSYRATVCPDQSYIIAIIDDTWAAPSHTGVILREDQVRDGLDFQLAKGTLIRGTITATSDESPLAGETVSLRQIGPELPEGFRSGPARREGGLLRWVKSDATGRYIIRVGPGTYEIRGPDQEGKWQRLVIAAEEEIVRHFAFDKPERKPLAGLVVDGTNDEKPVSGAIIFAAPTHEAKSHRPREFRATTDGQGRFKVLRDVGPMVLYARDVEGLLAGWVRVSDSQDEVTVPLASAARATGRVVDETGKPLAGQEVVRQLVIGIEGAQGSILNFTQLDSDGNTDANGAFTIPGLPDEAICRIHLLDTARRSFERVYGFYVRGSGRIAIPDLVVGADGPVPTTRPMMGPDGAASDPQVTGVVAPGVVAGEVIERTVNADAVGKDCVIDFDTGKLATPPQNPDGGFPAWFKAQGLDAGCTVEAASPGLWGFDMVVAPASAEMWEKQDKEPFLTLRNHVETGTIGTPAVMSASGKLPATYLFKTREGGVGVLQIVGFSEESKGLKIRYRLFSSGDKPRTAGPTPRATPAVGERKPPTSKPAANAESLKLPATLPAAGAEAGPPVVIQMSVVEITGKRDQLDPGKVLQLLPAGLTLKEGLEAVKGVGETEILAQPTIMVKPGQPATFRTGEKVPFVREMVTGENGKPQPKVTYENIGLTIDMKASWRPQSHPALADIGVHIRQTSLGQSMADVSSGVTAPVLSSRWCDRFVALHDGESVWIAGSEQAIPVARKEPGSKGEFKLLLVRLTANHQDESGASAATRPTGPVPMTRPAGSAN